MVKSNRLIDKRFPNAIYGHYLRFSSVRIGTLVQCKMAYNVTINERNLISLYHFMIYSIPTAEK